MNPYGDTNMKATEFATTQQRLLAACLTLQGLPLTRFLDQLQADNPGVPDLDQTTKIRTLARSARYISNVLGADTHLLHLAHQEATRQATENARRLAQRTHPQ